MTTGYTPGWLEKTPTGATGKPIYEAMDPVSRRQLRLLVCPLRQEWTVFPYLGLQRILMDADDGTTLVLIWSFATVIIRGRNLQEIARALRQDRCEVVRQFDPERYDLPGDKAAFVDSIEIHTERPEQGKTEGAARF